MNLLPHSNGLYKLKKEKINVMNIIKKIVIGIFCLIAAGFIIQQTVDILDSTKMKSRFKYVRIDGKRIEYKLDGRGQYTVVFDGDIGKTMFQWDSVLKEINNQGDVRTFVYNRQGYGFNDGGSTKSPKDAAEDLKSVLKKAGVTGKLILVGDKYGSLIVTNFAKEFPDSVSGVVLIDPIDEEIMKQDDYKKSIRGKYYRSEIEEIGSNFLLTTLMQKMGLTLENIQFKQTLSQSKLEEFSILENKSNYKQAVFNEYYNLYNGNSDSQDEDLLKDKQLYIITKDEGDSIKRIGDEDNTKFYKYDDKEDIFEVKDSNIIVNAINSVINKIIKSEKTN